MFMSIIETIQKFVQNDAQLARLFERVREYAELYLIAKQRQKGCDGMGEVTTLKDEFIYSLNEIINYCKEKGYLSGEILYETDSIARDICKIQPE
ncbi:MAG: hypothetical protein COY75_09280 [Nitrospirae bacterium CG_4_10_14_0_8_um_filter_41_23]|nr:MAG: hypothetical protein AUK38_03485 [Nitrospirae bacterium CG2_30_41_42]PIQ95253.1 MAG: hypothetical protein COV68_00285 [Nitrospirae bacterium CG11_big_fil_rev_8_21_14_0_20_41_14]PIV43891.1 MAG: hypothetical protein COS27_03560 [Nitrospirae bacterium CG02_land_8_20_14_3_00_41_53]PIW86520.1 MAG: hypothetical protein COZ94_09940 [Nitrospirae bacterium CG_4_8_14_3_um_filter_41_47]PIY86188.1 MAG: hypothetical protein COY75_09280 [Nitrospirae bacterium CG_4_10_14_0_8_um_filter_41_23]PJA80723.